MVQGFGLRAFILRHLGDLLGEVDGQELLDDKFNASSALKEDLIDLSFFDFLPVPGDSFCIFLELRIKLTHQCGTYIIKRIV